MWSRLLKLIWQVLNYHQDLQALKETVKQQGLLIRELAENQRTREHESQLQRERDARDVERAIHQLQLTVRDRGEHELWQENQRLRERLEKLEQHRLPPSDQKSDGE